MTWHEGVPILMYHEVAERAEVEKIAHRIQRGYILLRDEFEEQMEFIANSGFHAITLTQLYDWSRSSGALPPRPVVITFDDGFAGNHRHALPILKRFDLTGTFFVVTNRMGEPLMLDWADLREMQRAGMTVASHTANHPLLSTLTEERTREELAASKRMIEDRLGEHVRFLSLPNGDSNPAYARVASETGYLGGCGSKFGLNRRSTDRYFWRRIAVKHGVGLERFRNVLDAKASTMLRLTAASAGKAMVARVLGKRTYDRFYNLAFGVQEQDKSRQA